MHPLARFALICTVLLAGLTPAMTSARHWTPVGEDGLDLAAMVPLPSDLESVASTPVTAANGFYLDEDGYLAILPNALGDVRAVSRQLNRSDLVDAYTRSYQGVDGNGRSNPDDSYTFTFSRFDTESGTEDFFATVSEESNATDTHQTIGDESVKVELDSDAQGTAIVVRTGSILTVISVSIERNNSLEAADIEDLASATADRIELVLDGDGPDLGLLALRPESDAQFDYDAYHVLDDEFLAGTDDEQALIESWAGDATDAYSVIVTLEDPRDANENLEFQTRVLRFSSESDASAWFDEASDHVADGIDGMRSVDEIDGPDALGDASLALELAARMANGSRVPGAAIVVQVGDTIGYIALLSVIDPLIEAVAAMGELQAQCLTDEICDDPATIDADLFADTASSGDENDNSGDDDEITDGDVFTSENYGFTLTYDSDEWFVQREDSDADEGYDNILLQNDQGSVGLIFDPGYSEAGLGRCVDDYANAFGEGDGNSDLREMRGEGGEDAGRVWNAFTYDFDSDRGGTGEISMYVECRQLGDVTLVIIQISISDLYEKLTESRELLLEGLSES